MVGIHQETLVPLQRKEQGGIKSREAAELLFLLESSSLMDSGKSWEAPRCCVGTMASEHHFYGYTFGSWNSL